jgi:hypothetical protein
MNPELFFPHENHPPARYPTNKNFPPFFFFFFFFFLTLPLLLLLLLLLLLFPLRLYLNPTTQIQRRQRLPTTDIELRCDRSMQEKETEGKGSERERGADRASAKVRYASNERRRLREKSENGRTGEMHMGRKEGSKPAKDLDDRTLQPIHTCHLCRHAGKASEAGNLPAWR